MNGPLKDNKNPLRRSSAPPGKKIKVLGNRYRKELLAGTIAILIALIILIIINSGGTVANNTTSPSNQTPEIPTKVYSAGGIYLEYPASWNITTDEVNGNNIQIVIQDPASANNPNSAQLAAFTIIKAPKGPYETLDQKKDSFIKSLSSSGANIVPINATSITVSGINATETIYTGNGPKYEKIELDLISFEQSNMIYIMAFLTKGTDLKSQEPYFDIILKSFKIQWKL